MTAISSETLHASCVAIDGLAVLIEGCSGSGKSDLALRLIDRGARLVSDDYTMLVRQAGGLVAKPPESIAGRIEVRAIGIVELDHIADAPVALLIRAEDSPERMPESERRTIAGVTIPTLALDVREPSAPIKVELAVRRAANAAS